MKLYYFSATLVNTIHMKKLFTLLALAIVAIQVHAQRYHDKLFTEVAIDSVTYGQANTWNGTPQDLRMNIYQPVGDTVTKRPLLVLAHGGSFVQGSRYASDVTYLCTEFAKRGYICVSLDYRLGIDINSFFSAPGPQFANAVWRGTLDGRAAVRYLRANASLYKIDREQIYIGGVSAGGVLGLHEAFLDLPSEVGSANPSIDTAGIGGGIEGISGTPGQSWRVKGVISLCGGLGDVNWMSNNREVAIFSVHGTADQTVPYKTDYFVAYNLNVAKISGSFSVDSMAHVFGMKSFLHTFIGAPHVPFSPGVGTTESSTAYMDTTETLLRDFLQDDLGRHVGLPEVLQVSDVRVYPNPAMDILTIDIEKGSHTAISIRDINGKECLNVSTEKAHTVIDIQGLRSGLYFVNSTNEFGSITRKVMVH